jgi:hypothetical protein
VNDLKFESNANQSLLWIATDDGISLLDITNPESPSFSNFYNIANSGLIANGVKKITVDPGHVRWFGTFQGLSSFNKSIWASYSTQNYWIEHDKVVSLTSGPDSMVYIGTEGEGVSRLKMQKVDAITSASPLDKTWTGADQTDNGKLTSNNVYSIMVEQNGHQWFGTDKGVAVHTSYNTKRDWKNYTVNEGLVDNFVQAICRENKNSIWFGTPKGVSRFDGTTWKNYTAANGLAHNNVRDIALDNDGSLWFATEGGITVLTGTSSSANRKKLPLSEIRCFPNPFYLQTTIVYTLSTKANVKIDVYGINGLHIITLADELQSAGEHRISWNRINSAGNIVLPGVYFIQLKAGEQIKASKILITQ